MTSDDILALGALSPLIDFWSDKMTSILSHAESCLKTEMIILPAAELPGPITSVQHLSIGRAELANLSWNPN